MRRVYLPPVCLSGQQIMVWFLTPAPLLDFLRPVPWQAPRYHKSCCNSWSQFVVAIVVAIRGCSPWSEFVGAIVVAIVVAPPCSPWLQFVVAFVVAVMVAVVVAALENRAHKKRPLIGASAPAKASLEGFDLRNGLGR